MKKIEEQVFLDPIYGNIYVNYLVILKLIDTSAFQRLRRIKQLSSVSMIYHGACHSRFSHSLGVYFLATKFLENTNLKSHLNEREELLFLTSALLHDIGHGPHSHTFEQIFNTDHEKLGAKIILNDLEIVNILNEVDSTFKEDVKSILLKEGKYPLLEQLISSQLDVDRLDYLLRDAYYTGAPYGNIDLERLIRVLVIKDNKAYFKESGIPAIENYLINRHHMYFQVYFHRVSRAHEAVLENIYLRVKDLIKKNYQFKSNINLLKEIINDKNINIKNYLKLDDYYINGLIKAFTEEDDLILKNLSSDYLNRNIWNYIDYKKDLVNKINKNYNDKELKYYTNTNTAYNLTYDQRAGFGDKINILLKSGKTSTLYNESKIIKSLKTAGTKKDTKYYYR